MEDQVGRFDWKQKNVCKALHIEYYPDCILSMLIVYVVQFNMVLLILVLFYVSRVDTIAALADVM